MLRRHMHSLPNSGGLSQKLGKVKSYQEQEGAQSAGSKHWVSYCGDVAADRQSAFWSQKCPCTSCSGLLHPQRLAEVFELGPAVTESVLDYVEIRRFCPSFPELLPDLLLELACAACRLPDVQRPTCQIAQPVIYAPRDCSGAPRAVRRNCR